MGSKLKNVTMAAATGTVVAAKGTVVAATVVVMVAVAAVVARAAARGVGSGSKAGLPGSRCTQRLLPVRGWSPTRCSSRSLGRIRSPSEASGLCTNLVGLVP